MEYLERELQMSEDLTYRKLCELCREEKSTNSLIALPPDFEEGACALIGRMSDDSQKAPSAEAKREYENAQRLLAMLLRIRRQKVVFRALNDGQKHETAGMTEGDHALFDRMCSLVEQDDVRVAKTVSGRKTPAGNVGTGAEFQGAGQAAPDAQASFSGQEGENSIAAEVSNSLKRLRIIKDVKAYRGADGSTVGPFKIGDEVPLAGGEADLLVRGRLAESIE